MTKKRSYIFLIFPLISVTVVLLLVAHFSRLRRYEEIRMALGTMVQVTVATNLPKERVAELFDQCFEEIERLNQVFSRYQEASELAKINQQPELSHPLSDELFVVLNKAIDMHRQTDGAFDITVLPLIQAWKSWQEQNQMPKPAELQVVLEKVGAAELKLDRNLKTLSMPERFKLDLGGIAKAYIIGKVAQVLQTGHIQNILVNIGGDVWAQGVNERKTPWLLAIEHPQRQGEILATVPLHGRLMVTSGDYQRYFQIEGQKLSHILDPRTGYPVKGSLSITILGEDLLKVDALATAVSVLGPEKGLKLLKEQKNLDFLLFFQDNGKDMIFASKSMKERANGLVFTA